jgi:type I restriction enzyme S subunit
VSAPFNRFNGTYDQKHYLKGGELLFAWSGTPGTSFGAHMWGRGEALLNQHIFRVDFDDVLLDRRFFRHAINQKLTELIGVAHGGAGLQHVTKGVFESTEVVLPPRPEQKRIADKLDTVLTRVDAVNERLARVAPILKRFRQSVLAAATSGRLTSEWRSANGSSSEYQTVDLTIPYAHVISAPVTWTSKRFDQAIDLVGGSQPPKAVFSDVEKEGYVRLIQIRDYKSDKYKTHIPRDLARRFCTKSDVMIGRYGPPIFQILRGLEGAYNVALMKAVPKDGLFLNDYLYYMLQHPDLLRYVEAGSDRTAGQDGINKDHLIKYPVFIPSQDEQAEIVRRVETLFAFADRLEARLQAAQTAADRLTPSLLAKAFRGELVPQDPNDEPAAELLKRLATTTPTVAKRTQRKKSTA